MKRLLLFSKLRAGALFCFLICFAATLHAETWVEFNETNFPDPNMRAWLIKIAANPAASNNKVVLNADQTLIRTDILTNPGSLPANITDITGIRFFTSLKTVTLNLSYNLKVVDLRGLTKLTSLGLPSSSNSTIETLMLDGCSLTAISYDSYATLKTVSVKDCTKLTSIALTKCNLMGIDLSTCTALTSVDFSSNINMSFVKLPDTKTIKTIKLADTQVCELNLPTQAISATTFSGFTITNTLISYLDFSCMSGKAISGFLFSGTGLRVLPLNLNKIYESGTWVPAKASTTTTKFNAGNVDKIFIHKVGEFPGTYESITNVKNGTYDSSTGYITVNEGASEVTYTTKSWSASSGQRTFNVTATRELNPLSLYLEYYETSTAHKANVAATSDEVTPTRIPFTYKGDNIYELSLPKLFGNFRIVQVNSDGTEVNLGANSAQVTAHNPSSEQGVVKVEPQKSFALHKDLPARTASSLTRPAQPSWLYTTHNDESNGDYQTLENPTLEVSYINGNPAGTLTVTGGTVTGIQDVFIPEALNPDSESFDNNAAIEYYNLQGQRIENPSNGIFIRRQGNRATKVVLR